MKFERREPVNIGSSPMVPNVKFILIAVVVTMVAMGVIGSVIRLEEARDEAKELRTSLAGCQTAVEVQSIAAKADSERINTIAVVAAEAARGTLARSRQERRAVNVPGAGDGAMNKWLDQALP